MNDDELIHQYLNTKQNNYFETLYNRYVNKVYRRCLSLTKDSVKAEDFTHDIFLRVYGNLSNFKGNSAFSTWLYSISYNYCMDQLRRSKRDPTSSMDSYQDYQWADTPDPENMEGQLQLLATVMSAIAPEEARMLRLKYEDGLDIKEIASQLSLKDSAVKMRLKRTRDKIKRMYHESAT
ncbi:MAG: RNA polymerase sigma factor [Bacteroidetes bacterium]|nr:RNA polymerase sigma factor [Fibrella sp.]